MTLPQNWQASFLFSDFRESLLILLAARNVGKVDLAKSWTSKVSLDAAGIVALADLPTVALRTALTGTSTILDALVLCPGLHRQQAARELNHGEYPAAAALTTGYVFRIENPATIVYLQKVGRTAHLTRLLVGGQMDSSRSWLGVLACIFSYQNASTMSAVAYIMAVSTTVVAVVLLAMMNDFWGIGVLCVLVLARLCNVLVIRQRAEPGWKGAKEPGVKGDLFVALSQDRWIRMVGFVDDLKAVTSGEWLRRPTVLESFITSLATLMVYLDAALASNATQAGKIIILVLLIGSVGLLAIANEATEDLVMYGRVIKQEGKRTRYERRLELVNELVAETSRDDWALRMGLKVIERDEKVPGALRTGVIM